MCPVVEAPCSVSGLSTDFRLIKSLSVSYLHFGGSCCLCSKKVAAGEIRFIYQSGHLRIDKVQHHHTQPAIIKVLFFLIVQPRVNNCRFFERQSHETESSGAAGVIIYPRKIQNLMSRIRILSHCLLQCSFNKVAFKKSLFIKSILHMDKHGVFVIYFYSVFIIMIGIVIPV